eukprot:Platyproteum_vivax@DN2385_c0_g1_i2.p2
MMLCIYICVGTVNVEKTIWTYNLQFRMEDLAHTPASMEVCKVQTIQKETFKKAKETFKKFGELYAADLYEKAKAKAEEREATSVTAFVENLNDDRDFLEQSAVTYSND